ncbi:PHD finger-like domain-containing protein 5B, partial [Cucurbita argyrosperma subsp. sororia]
MAKHHPDLIMCRKQPGIAIGRLCEKCDGKCVICDSYVRPCTLVRVCDECNYGSFQGRCVICGGVGISDAYYCKECTQQEKDRDGCPKIVNLGSAKTDLFYERKKYGFKKRTTIAEELGSTKLMEGIHLLSLGTKVDEMNRFEIWLLLYMAFDSGISWNVFMLIVLLPVINPLLLDRKRKCIGSFPSMAL